MKSQESAIIESTRAMLSRRREQLAENTDAQFGEWLRSEIDSLQRDLHLYGEVA